MQIFILDRSPAAAAQMLCDVHLRKMCLENAQILSGVLLNSGKKLLPQMPKPCNANHPVIKAVNTPFKINWVILHNLALQREFFRRFGKYHAYNKITPLYFSLLFSAGSFEEDWSFCRNFKDFKPLSSDIIGAYREYYRFKKTVLPHWNYTGASEPRWLKNKIDIHCNETN